MSPADYFEIAMILAFGISWPINLYKAWKARTTRGTSILFLSLIFLGYIAGIISKFCNQDYMSNFGQRWYVLVVYFLNLIVVGANIVVYFMNWKIDRNINPKR